MPQKEATGLVKAHKVRVFGKSDIGRIRKENQDSFLITEPDDHDVLTRRGVLSVLTDGMGGLEDGKLASRLAVETVSRAYYTYQGGARAAIEAAVKEANSAIHRRATDGGGNRQMGSTVTALAIVGDNALIAQIGDSRAYRYRSGALRQLTRDHSLVYELLERGEIERDSEEYMFHRNILTRGLGLRKEVEVDVFELLCVEPGDTFLLSSDGLHELVSEAEMSTILARYGENLDEACADMVEVAREAGGPDNITVVLVQVSDDDLERTEALAATGTIDVRQEARRVGSLLPISLFLAFAFGVVLTLWIVQQGMPTIAEQEAAAQRLEKLFQQYEPDPGQPPAADKDEIVGRIRVILTELGLLPEAQEEGQGAAGAGRPGEE